jgi:deazaflavin-dependent oxidoreductase (nitroreductase family)
LPEKVSDPKPPRGLARLALRAPIWLYRAHLGWLLGHRFLRLTHTGRKSGLPRQNVLEIVRYDPATHTCIVASGWGEKSDWYRNITANPRVTVEVGTQRFPARAERLPAADGEKEMLDYARRHPMALRELASFMGYRLDGSQEDIRALGRLVPLFALQPLSADQKTT